MKCSPFLFLKHLEFNKNAKICCFSYNVADGVFTVPPGGEGLYYFSTFLTFRAGKWGSMQITKNRTTKLCTVWGGNQENQDDHKQSSCSAIVSLVPGIQDFPKLRTTQINVSHFFLPIPLLCLTQPHIIT